jgi:hypothetical protein
VTGRWRVIAITALAALVGSPLQAQQQQQAPQQQQPVTWDRLPRMQLEQMYAGPLQDTVIQRWRDPQTGMVCYLYLPFTVEHSARTATGSVQYGANTIGSLSCLESSEAAKTAAAQPAPPARKLPPAHAPAHPPAASEHEPASHE